MKRTLALLLCLSMVFCLFTACSGGGKGDNGVVNVYNWGEYIDEDVITQFENETGITVNYKNFDTNESLYSVLKQGGVSYDVIFPSDYMASRMIDEGLVQKINLDNVPNLSLIDEDFLSMEYDPSGEYTVPYMWGVTGIIYNSTMVDEEITSWGALFDTKYSGQILMFDNSRDSLGIALMYLGYSLNTTNEAELEQAYNLLVTQKPLLQAYVMDQIFDKLEGGEAAIAPYYAGDYLTMLENNPDLKFVVPDEGSNLFVDVMCIPSNAENVENAEAFIDFMCRTDISLANSEYIGYTSPNTEVGTEIELDETWRSVMYPSASILARCEAYINLPIATLEAYDNYWILLKK